MKKVEKFFSKLHPNVPIIITNHQTAEMIKYANNSFLATKISFINQLSNICQNIPGANIDDIAKTIGLDPRIGKLFLMQDLVMEVHAFQKYESLDKFCKMVLGLNQYFLTR